VSEEYPPHHAFNTVSHLKRMVADICSFGCVFLALFHTGRQRRFRNYSHQFDRELLEEMEQKLEGKQRGDYLGQTSRLLSDKVLGFQRHKLENSIVKFVDFSFVIPTLTEYLFPTFKKLRHRARLRARWSQSTGQTLMGITIKVRTHMTIATSK
jgi:hypothetical protein